MRRIEYGYDTTGEFVIKVEDVRDGTDPVVGEFIIDVHEVRFSRASTHAIRAFMQFGKTGQFRTIEEGK